jgi:hypothetical protein
VASSQQKDDVQDGGPRFFFLSGMAAFGCAVQGHSLPLYSKKKIKPII